MTSPPPKLESARRALVPVTLFAAAAFLAWFVNTKEPLSAWLLWPYVGFWVATLVWLVACAGAGHAVLRGLPDLDLRFRERLLFDLAVGVLAFAVGLFLCGVLGLLRSLFFILYPLGLGGVGVALSVGDWRRAWRRFSAARRRAGERPSIIHHAAVALGTLSLAIVCLSVLVPDNVAFDSRTYHLPVAEFYAAAGRITRFPEGWFAGTLPQLASWLYTWPFTLRTVNLFGRVELAAHLELGLFVATVFSVPLLVEVISPGRRARGTWALFFLFPGLFLYDSSLGCAADHVLAFWATPIAIAALRFAQRPASAGRGALLGLVMAGAALTKYQAIYILVPASLLVGAVLARALWRARREAQLRTIAPPLARGAAAWIGAAAIATAPHWLGHLVWYGNPVYPQLLSLFPSRPLVPGWPGLVMDTQFELHGPLLDRIFQAGSAVATFSFVPNDWWPFHHDIPVFGFLFTLTLPVLLLAVGVARARVLAAATLVGVFIWYWTYHQDRYLQSLVPWMVACTAVALRAAWDAGVVARVGAGLLVALQAAWGGDVPWLPTHAMTHDVPAIEALRSFSSTFRGERTGRLSYNTGFEELDHTLPKDAYVVLHEEYLRLGLNRRAMQDSLRWQAGIDYRYLRRPDRVHELLASLGATHLVWSRGGSVNKEVPVSGELVFWGYALRYGEGRFDAGGFGVARLPARRPPPREPGLVTYVGCGRGATRTVPLAEVDDTVTAEGTNGPSTRDVAAAVASAEFVVVKAQCQSLVASGMMGPFVQAPPWGDVTLWVRSL